MAYICKYCKEVDKYVSINSRCKPLIHMAEFDICIRYMAHNPNMSKFCATCVNNIASNIKHRYAQLGMVNEYATLHTCANAFQRYPRYAQYIAHPCTKCKLGKYLFDITRRVISTRRNKQRKINVIQKIHCIISSTVFHIPDIVNTITSYY
jgi:hypothetical protein